MYVLAGSKMKGIGLFRKGGSIGIIYLIAYISSLTAMWKGGMVLEVGGGESQRRLKVDSS